MEVWEKINYLLEEKGLSKQEFASRLIMLEPKLKRTGEVPSLPTVMGYLYGKRELKIELVPYIAEVLGVSEGELFSFEIEYANSYNTTHSKQAREIVDLLQYAPKIMVEHIVEQLRRYKELYKEGVKIIKKESDSSLLRR